MRGDEVASARDGCPMTGDDSLVGALPADQLYVQTLWSILSSSTHNDDNHSTGNSIIVTLCALTLSAARRVSRCPTAAPHGPYVRSVCYWPSC